MEIRKIAVVIFYTKDNKILLQNRRNISRVGEEWGFFGGRIEKGETPEQAVVREIKEELDYALCDHHFIGQHTTKIDNDYTLEWFVFISPLEDKFDKFTVLEGAGMKIYTLDQAKQLKMISSNYHILDMFKKIRQIKTR